MLLVRKKDRLECEHCDRLITTLTLEQSGVRTVTHMLLPHIKECEHCVRLITTITLEQSGVRTVINTNVTPSHKRQTYNNYHPRIVLSANSNKYICYSLN